LDGLRTALEAFWTAGIEEVCLDGSFCTEKPDPGDIDGYWVEPGPDVHERIDPYWIDFELILVPHVREGKWRMWVEPGVEFFIHPAMRARPEMGFPKFLQPDRDGQPRGVIRVLRTSRS
jgi:hypothetical protein